MNNKKMLKRKIPSQSEDSENGYGSQASTSQAFKRLTNTSEDEEIHRLVNDCVYFMIIADQKKVPFKRTDIIKHILKGKAKGYHDVLHLAKQKLKKVFGYEVVELEEKKNSYILVNKLNTIAESSCIYESEEECNMTGLLIIILSLIFMNGNVLNEAILWSTLKKLGVEPGTPHAVFGDVRKLIMNEFKQQAYIEVNKILGSDPISYQLTWGPRAFLESTKKKILEFVCTIYGNMNPDQWTEQFHDTEENQRHSSTNT